MRKLTQKIYLTVNQTKYLNFRFCITYVSALPPKVGGLSKKIQAPDSYVSNFDGSHLCEKCQKKLWFHWFAECALLIQFWVRFFEWVHETFTAKIEFSKEIVIFEYLENNEFEINYCSLQVKWFIHKFWKLYNNMNKTHFSFKTFL